MCWSAEVSLNTFLFSLFGGAFGYFNGMISGFSFLYFISFILIQLIEYFTWNNLYDKKTNRLISQIALFVIIMQIPFYIYSQETFPYKSSLLAIYLLFITGTLCYFNIDFSMNKAANGHLAWNWLNFPPWILFIWVSFILGLCLYEKRYVAFIGYFIFLAWVYYAYHESNTWGSLWCWVANLHALVLIGQVFLKDLCF